METTAEFLLGTAVLVHGSWSNPGDWQWTRRLLEDRGVHVETPDLPSHRRLDAGLLDDADEVRDRIRSSPGPVVVAGWSYGGDVIGIAADGEPSVVRLVYVSAAPQIVGSADRFAGFLDHEDPHFIVDRARGTLVINNDWWVYEEKGLSFPPEVQEHIRSTPRRPFTITAASEPVRAAAWTSIPTTVLLGRDDELVSADERQWIEQTFDDVREVDTDHFILFNRPEVIADAVVEALEEARQRA